jgi:hypothetical protein
MLSSAINETLGSRTCTFSMSDVEGGVMGDVKKGIEPKE